MPGFRIPGPFPIMEQIRETGLVNFSLKATMESIHGYDGLQIPIVFNPVDE